MQDIDDVIEHLWWEVSSRHRGCFRRLVTWNDVAVTGTAVTLGDFENQIFEGKLFTVRTLVCSFANRNDITSVTRLAEGNVM